VTDTEDLSVFKGRRFRAAWVLYGLAVLWLGVAAWQVTKPMPPGTDTDAAAIAVDKDRVKFLTDLTYTDARGQPVHEQKIFDAVFQLIDGAQHFIVLDYFLFNSEMGNSKDALRPLSRELADHLLAKKHATPQIPILLITDPINDVYGGAPSALLDELRAGGIEVVVTDLNKLRDSNPLYSAFWRIAVQWFGNSAEGGAFDNPFEAGPEKVSLRSWLALLNFKANHRKVIVADDASGDIVGIVSSANPHDASSAHSNVALRFTGEVAQHALMSELTVARISGWTGAAYTPALPTAAAPDPAQSVMLRFVTERAILERLLAAIAETRNGDTVRIAMFYLSDRSVVSALLDAAERGVDVKLILDPNRDAFGREKDGVPNRPVANELVEKSAQKIAIRWYRTHGEQFHTKLALVTHGDRFTATLGSANLTRRNVENYNLEANILLQSASSAPLAKEMLGYFDRLWSNEGTTEFTAPFGAFRDDTWQSYWRYRFMEATGLSTF
jgi:phosphatidylserine/phosphatidylglycerophosphate/cardiolipin synthase-like enzyme